MVRILFFVVAGLVAGCGVNDVTIEIKGGDGHPVRLDVYRLEHKFNKLVETGSQTFHKKKRGDYQINVVAGSYLASHKLTIDPAPISGVTNFPVTFDIPAGANSGMKREGTIVYASTKTNVRNWDLFTVKADGSGISQLTDTRDDEQYPKWSPDGKKILFTRGSVMTNIDIYVMNADGSEVNQLTEHPERDQQAEWSPDGQHIVFVSQRDGEVELWVMDTDGGNKRKLVQGREPSWSPDGKRIAFVSSYFAGHDEIYLINPDGTDRQQLTDQKKTDWFPAWTPQGDRLAFCSERFGGQEIMIMKSNGEAQTRVTVYEKSYEQEPVWSPDGKGIAYSGKMDESGDDSLKDEDYDIYLIEAAGFVVDDVETQMGERVNLTNDSERNDKSPSWRVY
jgi:Tol biopolymer transport system component